MLHGDVEEVRRAAGGIEGFVEGEGARFAVPGLGGSGLGERACTRVGSEASLGFVDEVKGLVECDLRSQWTLVNYITL